MQIVTALLKLNTLIDFEKKMLETSKPKLLIVDNLQAIVISLQTQLSTVDAEFIHAHSKNEVLEKILEHDFAVFLINVQIPEINGYEIATFLQGEIKTQDVPIIFITAKLHNIIYQNIDFTHGAIDTIEAPINNDLLLSKIGTLIKLWQKNNELNQVLQDIAKQNYALQSEVSERKKIQAKLNHVAMYDPLTNLPNRSLLNKESEKQLSAAHRYDYHVGFMFLDLDGFKAVNENHGHETGDGVLIEMTYRIVSSVRVCDIVTRFGSDEFVIVLPNCKSKSDIETIAARMLQKIKQPISPGDSKHKLGASIGITIYPEDGTTSNELISLADKAMCMAKQAGKNQYKFAHL